MGNLLIVPRETLLLTIGASEKSQPKRNERERHKAILIRGDALPEHTDIKGSHGVGKAHDKAIP